MNYSNNKDNRDRKFPFSKFILGRFHKWTGIKDDNVEEALIELNKKYLLYHQVNSWDKAIKQGIVTGGTVPKDVLTKGDLMVFFDRMGFFK